MPFGGTVQLPAGIYTDNLEVLAGKELTIVGLDGTNTNNVLAGVAASGLPTIDVPAGADLTLDNLHVTDGEDSGIQNEGTLQLDGVLVSGNATTTPVDPRAGHYGGGGILNTTAAVLEITDSVIDDNESTGDVGSVPAGGGISNYGTLAVVDSSITNNTAGQLGGGISNYFTGTLTITGTSSIDGQHCRFWWRHL